MGRLFARLLSNAEPAPAATPATLATLPGPTPVIVAESQESQWASVEEIHAHLLTLADQEGIDAAHVHRLDDDELAAYANLPDLTSRAHLRALGRDHGMDAGKVPADFQHVAQCDRCGPVWWHTAERRTCCPWCFKRAAGKVIPRPPVRCGDCTHYTPDPLNPEAGTGTCAQGAGRSHWPMQAHPCPDWRHAVSAGIAQANNLGVIDG